MSDAEQEKHSNEPPESNVVVSDEEHKEEENSPRSSQSSYSSPSGYSSYSGSDKIKKPKKHKKKKHKKKKSLDDLFDPLLAPMERRNSAEQLELGDDPSQQTSVEKMIEKFLMCLFIKQVAILLLTLGAFYLDLFSGLDEYPIVIMLLVFLVGVPGASFLAMIYLKDCVKMPIVGLAIYITFIISEAIAYSLLDSICTVRFIFAMQLGECAVTFGAWIYVGTRKHDFSVLWNTLICFLCLAVTFGLIYIFFCQLAFEMGLILAATYTILFCASVWQLRSYNAFNLGKEDCVIGSIYVYLIFLQVIMKVHRICTK